MNEAMGGHSLIIASRLAAVNIVPPVAGELLLAEDGAVGAQEWGTLMTFTAVVTDVIGLTSGLDVGVHSRGGGHISTVETGLWYWMVDGIVVAGNPGNLIEILLFLPLTVWMVLFVWVIETAESLKENARSLLVKIPNLYSTFRGNHFKIDWLNERVMWSTFEWFRFVFVSLTGNMLQWFSIEMTQWRGWRFGNISILPRLYNPISDFSPLPQDLRTDGSSILPQFGRNAHSR